MAAPVQWLQRIPGILEELRRAKHVAYLDRPAIEELFGVKDRRARALLRQFGAVLVGNAFAVDRLSLIAGLEKIQAGDNFYHDRTRRQRVARLLQQARQEHPARQATIRTAPIEDRRPTLASLPSGVTLAPGEFRVAFAGFDDFAQKLSLFLVVLQNQVEEIRELADGTGQCNCADT